MAANSQCYVDWKELYVCRERGKRLVHFFLKDPWGGSVLAVVGTERSVRHMFYVVADEFLRVNEAENSVHAGYRWRSRREVVIWLNSMLSKPHQQGEHFKSPKSEHISGVGTSFQNRLAKNPNIRVPDIVWSGSPWTCGKQLKHFPGFCRNGITIDVQSFVYVMAEEERSHLAHLEDMYEDRKGQKKVKVRWFHHTQEVQAVVTLKNPHPKEVFITSYVQVISAECVDGLALVLAGEHYEKCVSTLPEDLLTRVHLCSRQFKNNRVKPFKLTSLGGYFNQPVFSVLDPDLLEDEENGPRDDAKVGARRPRSSRGRQMVSDDFSMDVKYEILRRKLIPKHVKIPGSNVTAFRVNEKIELLSLDSGIRGCWFRCTILELTKKRMKVQYDDLMEEGGSGKLEEWVPAFRLATPEKLGIRCVGRPTARPARTENDANVAAFEVGSPVDGWWCDGWWEGVVTRICESNDGDLQVYIPGENLFLELRKKNVRVSKDWTGDHWVDLETKPNILSLIPANTNETKPGSLLLSSKEEPIDPQEPVDPCEPVNGSNDNGPLQEGDPEPIDQLEPVGASNDNKPLQEEGDPNPNPSPNPNPNPNSELLEKEKDPSPAHDVTDLQMDDLQIDEKGEPARENMEEEEEEEAEHASENMEEEEEEEEGAHASENMEEE